MNVGGPAVQVSELMRGLNSIDFDCRLYSGFAPLTRSTTSIRLQPPLALRVEGFVRRKSLGVDTKDSLKRTTFKAF